MADKLPATNEEILAELRLLSQRIGFLERTAPGRGTTYLGNDRLLTRLSLAEMFYGDPAFIVSASDRSIVPRLITDGVYEQDSTYYVCNRVRTARRCVDVGANFGYFTIVMARHAPEAHIIALEPVVASFDLLRENVDINYAGERCTLLNKGASNGARKLRMSVEQSHLGDAHVVGASDAFAVETDFVALDDLLADYDHVCDFAKIDVEGHEPLVLEGMRTTINKNPDLSILMEWSLKHIARAGNAAANFCAQISDLCLKPYIVSRFGVLAATPVERLLDIEMTNIVL